MGFARRFINFILEPVKYIVNRDFAERTARFFTRRRIAIYILSFIITFLIIYFSYFA